MEADLGGFCARRHVVRAALGQEKGVQRGTARGLPEFEPNDVASRSLRCSGERRLDLRV